MLQRGLPQFGAIRSSLSLISGAIASGQLPAPASRQSFRPQTLYKPADSLLSVQRIAGAIASIYGLRVRLINVSFQSAMQLAGRVELGPGDEFFVEVQSDLRGDPMRVAAVLAHELAHIVLHRAELSLGTVPEDEILTDCTAIAYGFGVISLDSYEVSEHRHGDMIQRVEQKLGYLTPEEMGFVVALCGRPTPSRFEFKSAAARAAYLWGQRYLRRHLGWPPLAWAPLHRRAFYWLSRQTARRSAHAAVAPSLRDQPYAFDTRGGFAVIFRCPLCAQGLRVPVRNPVVLVRCHSCKFAFEVSP